MPPTRKYTRDDVIQCSLKIVEEEGMDALNARRIAGELHSSIQPIFHNFKTMDELKDAVVEEVYHVYQDYILQGLDTEKPYKQIGLNYIHFAKEKPNLFRILFMRKSSMTRETFGYQDESFQRILDVMKEKTEVTEELKEFHFKIWIFTHGIAVLIVSGMCEFTEEEISALLTEEYQALLKRKDLRNEKDK